MRQATSLLCNRATTAASACAHLHSWDGTIPMPTAVFSFGNGSQGALGCGSTDDNYEPEQVALPDDVQSVAAGHYHSLAITSEGQLYSWGRNQELQLGRPTEASHEHYGVAAFPGLVVGLPTPVKSCAASGVATLAVGIDGRVHAFGRSKRGQLGLGRSTVAAAVPEPVPGLEGVLSVSCGWGHALALTEDGDVYAWGYPAAGRLGNFFGAAHEEVSEQEVLQSCVWTPQKLVALTGVKAKQVCCSLDSSLVVGEEDGTLFTCGDNSLAQLGRPPGRAPERNAEDWIVQQADGPRLLVRAVAAGLSHCLATTTDGQVMVWGWKHGLQEHDETLHLPEGIAGLSASSSCRPLLAAGRVHSLVAPDLGLLAFGNGQNGRLGLGSSQSAGSPEAVPGFEGAHAVDIACGHDHSLILLQTS